MKRVVCISPHFPPVNAPDMHRLRQALPYLREFGWDPVVFTVDPQRVEGAKDDLLLRTVPPDVEIHPVAAVPAGLTRRVGLGNLGFRSWFQLREGVDAYLRRHGADLIFFTTTVFASMAHGPHWKRRFGVPFVVDLQDPWRNDYYLSLPKRRRPRKFWFDHWQKSLLEARTMPEADGVIAVSRAYIDTIRSRYPSTCRTPVSVLPFGAMPSDLDVARNLPPVIRREPGTLSVVYVGRGGRDMARSLSILFQAVRQGLDEQPEAFSRLRFHFLGTSYAAEGRGEKTIAPLAEGFGLSMLVNEVTDRLPYFEALRALLDADLLVVPGSDDPGYTASKIFPYVHAGKPLLAVFHDESSAVQILRGSRMARIATFSTPPDDAAVDVCRSALALTASRAPDARELDLDFMEQYSAREMTRSMVRLFDEVTGRP